MAGTTQDSVAKQETARWRRRGRVLLTLLAATAAVLALMAHFNAHLAGIVRDVAPDPTASMRIGRLQYCPAAADPCCERPADRDCLLAFESEGGPRAQIDIVVWLALDVAFALLYATLIALACRWAASLFGFPTRWGALFAAIAWAAALADIVENGAQLLLLYSVGEPTLRWSVTVAQQLAWLCGALKWGIALPIGALVIAVAWRGKDQFWRCMVYFAVLRPSFVFAAILLYLPLSAIETAPLSSMLGNLLVDYRFGKAFWLGLVLFPTVWSLMFTACLMLDSERKRDPEWVPAPADPDDWTVTLPIRDPWIFGAFTMIAAPTLVVVAWTAADASHARTLAGALLGGLVAYVFLDLSMSVLWRDGKNLRSLPWEPLAARWIPARVAAACEVFSAWFRRLASWGARVIGMSPSMFTADDPTLLEDDHVFAAWSLTVMLVLYVVLSVALGQVARAGRFDVLYALPPAGFLYVILLWLVWLISLVWFVFRRYRLALAAIVVAGLFLYAVSNQRGSEYTFEATQMPAPLAPLTVQQILQPLQPDDPIIVVAASGGGIAAAGWTTKVLAELRARIPDFDRQLRLLSTVSGGSVGSAHYLNAAERAREGGPALKDAMPSVISASMDTSLSATAYGFAFPEVHRLVFPFFATEISDRGRLQERTWQWRADCGRSEGPRKLSDLAAGVTEGTLPAVIFNTTLMETGGRVAVTNVGAITDATDQASRLPQLPRRWLNPRSLSDFLSAPQDPQYWTVDLWTGARLSATFSYVSPAAALAGGKAGDPTVRHLIDGGYHDNFGVASALDWLEQAAPALAGRRVALIEIRASPQDEATKPASGLAAEWLGPVLGMWNAWWRSQTETNDTALNRLVSRYPGRFQTFLFAPDREPPLSWHLSRHQQQQICEAWADRPLRNSNQQQLHALLAFLGQTDSTGPDAVPCDLPDPCGT